MRRAVNKPLIDAKNAVRGAISSNGRSLATLERELSVIPLEEFNALATWAERQYALKFSLSLPGKCQNYGQLFSSRVPRLTSLQRQIYWLLRDLRSHSVLLIRYLALSDRFETAWLEGDIERAGGLLEEIEAETGKSLWLIEARLSFLQRTRGLEVQKEFAASVHDSAPRTIAAFIAHYISVRNEDNISVGRFSQLISRDLASQTLSSSAALYLTATLTGRIPSTENELRDLLQFASRSSAVDAFRTLVEIIPPIIKILKQFKTHSALAEFLVPLEKAHWMPEALIDLLLERAPRRNIADATPWEGLIKGNFEQCQRTCIEALLRSPSELAPLEPLAIASAITEIVPDSRELPPLARELLPLLIIIVGRKGGVYASLAEAKKYFTNLRCISRMRAVEEFLEEDWNTTISAEQGTSAIRRTLTPQVNIGATGALTPKVSAELLKRLPNNVTAVAQYFSLIEGISVTISEAAIEFAEHARIASSLKFGQKSNLFAAAERLGRSEVGFWRRRASRYTVTGLLANGELERAVRTAATMCLEEPDTRFLMPFDQLFSGKEWRDLENLKGDLALPICLSIYTSIHKESGQQSNLRAAYDSFIRSNGVARPSQLEVSRYDKVAISFFLENVCIPEVMDVSFQSFRTSRELDEERIRVCQLLQKLNPDQSGKYNDEIKDITKYLSLHDALLDVDRSRVYVDLDAVARWCSHELSEPFARYKDYLKSGLVVPSQDNFDTALRKASEGDADALSPYVTYPEDEASSLLRDMIWAVETEYLENKDYGLNAYLSMRIRHGSLAGNLRGAFQNHHMICSRDDTSDRYLDIEYWDSALRFVPAEVRKRVQEALKRFSRSFDAVVEEFTRNRLQVQSAQYPQGMFYLEKGPFWLHFVRHRIESGATLADFIDSALFTVYARMQIRLGAVKQYIEVDTSSQIGKHVEQLRSDLAECLDEDGEGKISASLNQASIEFQHAIRRVAAWFSPTREALSSQSLTLEQIVDVALEATRGAYSGFSPVIKKEIVDIGLFSSEVLSEITDILFVMLGNVFQHSGLGSAPEASIVVTGSELEGQRTNLLIRVESRVGPGVKNAETELKLQRIRGLIMSGEYRERVNLEGGTGLLKLQRMVAGDIRRKLDFGFVDESSFFVEINLPIVHLAVSNGSV